jgi:diaminopimelate epimerase
MNFTKLQGAGNDFILVETEDTRRNWANLARAMCNRHFGVGADGLLLLMPSETADVRMRIFNADGSEAEACGNGIRCLAKYAVNKNLIPSDRDYVMIETMAGTRKITISQSNGETTFRVGMGIPKFSPGDIPVTLERGNGKIIDITSPLSYSVNIDGMDMVLNFISMGNPHAVCFWQQAVADFPLSILGPEIEHLPIFPNRTNFEIVNVVSQNQLEIRVWERGAGETMACGTGACAAAVIAQLKKYIGREVDIKLLGGTLKIEWDGTGEVLLGGDAELVFTGNWESED